MPATVLPILPAPIIPTVVPNSSWESRPSTSGRIQSPATVSPAATVRCRIVESISVMANSATGIAFAPPLFATGIPNSPASLRLIPSNPAEQS